MDSNTIREHSSPKLDQHIRSCLTEIDIGQLHDSDRQCSICREPLRTSLHGKVTACQVIVSYTSNADANARSPEHRIGSNVNEDLDSESENPASEVPVRLSCGHIFGKDCITTWLSFPSRWTCPKCRAEVISPLSPTPGLIIWRALRAELLQKAFDRIGELYITPAEDVLAQRAIRFVEANTSNEEEPDRHMRSVCEIMARCPYNMIRMRNETSGVLERYIDDLERDLDHVLSEDDGRQIPRGDVVHLIWLVRAEIRTCAEACDAMKRGSNMVNRR